MRDDGDEIAGLMNIEKIGGMRGEVLTVSVAADDEAVRLKLSVSSVHAAMTPEQARFIARKLYRMARLADQRIAERIVEDAS